MTDSHRGAGYMPQRQEGVTPIPPQGGTGTTAARTRSAGALDVAFGMVSLEDAERMAEERYWEGYRQGCKDYRELDAVARMKLTASYRQEAEDRMAQANYKRVK